MRLFNLFLVILAGFLLSNCSTTRRSVSSGGLQPGDAEWYALAVSETPVEMAPLREIAAEAADIKITDGIAAADNSASAFKSFVFKTDTVIPEDSVEVEPVIHPFAYIGVGLTGAAAVAGVLVVTGPMISILWPLLLLGGGLLFATLAIKNIKRDPKKYKGEKLANAVYWAMIPIGLLLMLLPIYWMFNF